MGIFHESQGDNIHERQGKRRAKSLSAHYPRHKNQVPARRFSLGTGLGRAFRRKPTIALNRLVAEGLLQKLPKKGCFIPNLNYDDARAAFSVRILLECEAARCAAQNAQAEDLLEMERILAATEEAIDTDNFLSFTFRDEDFHHALVQASDNMYLYEAWARIYLRCNLYTRFFDRLYTRKTPLKSGTLAEHTAIFNALGHNDTELAVSLVEKHRKDALSYVTNS